jgi:hypothetical protein
MSSASQALRPTLRPLPRPRGLSVVPVIPHDDPPAGDLDTMVDLPAAPPSDVRELAVRRPPRPTPRSRPPEPMLATTSPPPLPSPVASKNEPATTQEADTIELDASCIEEACALASAAPASKSRRVFGFLEAVAFFVVFVALAAGRWLRATFLPATRAVAAAARARLVIEWERASRSARHG